MSFFCPHFDQETNGCTRLKVECVPGRRGCVLRGKVQFLTDPDERVAKKPAARTGTRSKSGSRPA